MHRCDLLLGLGFLSLAASGCRAVQAYPGERLPAHQVAVLHAVSERAYFFWYLNRITLRDIDSVRLTDFRASNAAEILPGERVVRVIFEREFPTGRWKSLRAGPVPITFAARAAHEYHIRGRATEVAESWSLRIWIQDAETKEIIADENVARRYISLTSADADYVEELPPEPQIPPVGD